MKRKDMLKSLAVVASMYLLIAVVNLATTMQVIMEYGIPQEAALQTVIGMIALFFHVIFLAIIGIVSVIFAKVAE